MIAGVSVEAGQEAMVLVSEDGTDTDPAAEVAGRTASSHGLVPSAHRRFDPRGAVAYPISEAVMACLPSHAW